MEENERANALARRAAKLYRLSQIRKERTALRVEEAELESEVDRITRELEGNADEHITITDTGPY